MGTTSKLSDADLSILGGRLRHAMDEKGIGVNELDRLADLGPGTTSRLRNGRKLKANADHIERIAKALGVEPGWLMYGAGPMKRQSGTQPALYIVAKTSKPNLARVLVSMNTKRRWPPHVVAAAEALGQDRATDEWPSVLDDMRDSLAGVLDG